MKRYLFYLLCTLLLLSCATPRQTDKTKLDTTTVETQDTNVVVVHDVQGVSTLMGSLSGTQVSESEDSETIFEDITHTVNPDGSETTHTRRAIKRKHTQTDNNETDITFAQSDSLQQIDIQSSAYSHNTTTATHQQTQTKTRKSPLPLFIFFGFMFALLIYLKYKTK